jgi:hypothetical protein
MTKPQTKFVNNISPFTGMKVVKPPPVSIDQLEICADPIPSTKAAPKYKYDSVFDVLKLGECIACPSDRISAVSGAMRTYLKRTGKGGRVVSTLRYADGRGRIWWTK